MKLYMKSTNSLLSLILLAFLSSCSTNKAKEDSPISPGVVTIRGIIEEYDQSYSTGQIYYFDGLSRLNRSELISIDSGGAFITMIRIAHQTPTLYLRLGNRAIPLTVSPGQEYNISIKKEEDATFLGKNGELNNHKNKLERAIFDAFKGEYRIRSQYNDRDSISYSEYYDFCIGLSKRKLSFAEEYCRENKFSQKVYQLVKQNILYEPAWAMLNYRWIIGNRTMIERKDLPEDFVGTLIKDFPINNPDAISSRSYHDYLTNILDIMREELISSEAFMESLRSSESFTEEELSLWKAVYSLDGKTYGSKEYKQLVQDKGEIEQKVFRKESLKKVLTYSAKLPEGIGRDFIISQGVSRYCFDTPLMPPLESDWEELSSLISNEIVYAELTRMNNLLIAEQDDTDQTNINRIEPLENVKADEVFNKLIGKYTGKVVYIDFWATWCGPCRDEIAFSRVLQKQFKDLDVVFLNLCCRSPRKTWEKLIQSEQITGENYLLGIDENNFLTEKFNIQGIPHYVLVDRNGEVANSNAYRPSSDHLISSEIQVLLDN